MQSHGSVPAAEEAAHSKAARPAAILAALIVLLALALRLGALGKFSLDNDEIAEVEWSRLPFSEMLRTIEGDRVHPPVDYLLQWSLSRVDPPEWARRLPAAAAGTATVFLMMALASSWFGLEAALAVGLLLAFSPMLIRYSQEIRPYALGLFFLALALFLLERYRTGRKRRAAVGWFFAVGAAGLTLYFAGLVTAIASIALIFLYRKDDLRDLWRRLPLVLLGWVALYGFWLPVLFRAAAAPPVAPREPLTLAWVEYRLQVFGTGDWKIEPVTLGSWAFWLIVSIGLFFGRPRKRRLAAAAWVVLGSAAEIAILEVRPHFVAVRHLLPAWLGAFLLAAAGFAAIRRLPKGSAAAWIFPLLVLAFDGQTLLAYYHHGRPRWNAVANFLRSNLQPGEHVVVTNSWTARNLGYYWASGPPLLEPLPQQGQDIPVAGPGWLVIAECPVSPADRPIVESLPLRASFLHTNYCEIRYLPAGRAIAFPVPLCSKY
jgi:4-amino-4-deoxy-L-arabinose transferase-like glycosyltransferase